MGMDQTTARQQHFRAKYIRAMEKKPAFNGLRLALILKAHAPDPDAPNEYAIAADAARLVHLAKSLESLSVASCNTGLSERQETRRFNLAKEAELIASWYGLKVHAYGDPRGYVLKLLPGREGQELPRNEMGGAFGIG